MNNHFNIFLRILYIICRLCTNGISATIDMGVRCVRASGKTFVIQTTVGQQTDHHYYVVKYSRIGLRHFEI